MSMRTGIIKNVNIHGGNIFYRCVMIYGGLSIDLPGLILRYGIGCFSVKHRKLPAKVLNEKISSVHFFE